MPRDQPQPGSFLNKREEPGNEVVRYPVSHTAEEGRAFFKNSSVGGPTTKRDHTIPSVEK